MLLLALLAIAALQAGAIAPAPPPDYLAQLVAAAAGVAAAGVLGGVKYVTGALDTKIGQAIKPVQPLLVGILGAALPLLSNALHVSDLPTASTLVAAPIAGFFGVLARELTLKLASKAASS